VLKPGHGAHETGVGGGASEGTAHKALGSIWVVEEADLQGNEPILQRQRLDNLMALPVPHM
jgi:hypothetical protein